ncbi:MAG: M23 family metallopeptidase [Cyclobacteriaceae bacterium]
MNFVLFYLLILIIPSQEPDLVLPIGRRDSGLVSIQVTNIGKFGLERVARPGIPKHLHTGIDIKPPRDNYFTDEFIYPIARGVVISKRTDGPYAQLIIEHEYKGTPFWTVYEHISEIQADLFQPVTPDKAIARFFKSYELDKIGWQFNHFHFEILRKRPIEIKPDPEQPERRFNSYTLICQSESALHEYFHNPIAFLRK